MKSVIEELQEAAEVGGTWRDDPPVDYRDFVDGHNNESFYKILLRLYKIGPKTWYPVYVYRAGQKSPIQVVGGFSSIIYDSVRDRFKSIIERKGFRQGVIKMIFPNHEDPVDFIIENSREEHPLLSRAESIARAGHRFQFRRDEVTPYIRHLEDVVDRLSSECDEIKMVGWLHDTLEDTHYKVEDLLMAELPGDVVKAVFDLTKRPGEAYHADYLPRVKRNPMARTVKFADIYSNLADDPTEYQKLKYKEALEYLTS